MRGCWRTEWHLAGQRLRRLDEFLPDEVTALGYFWRTPSRKNKSFSVLDGAPPAVWLLGCGREAELFREPDKFR